MFPENGTIYVTAADICLWIKTGKTVEIAADAKDAVVSEIKKHNLQNKFDFDSIDFIPTAGGWKLKERRNQRNA